MCQKPKILFRKCHDLLFVNNLKNALFQQDFFNDLATQFPIIILKFFDNFPNEYYNLGSTCDPAAACSKDCKQAWLACRKYSFEKSLSHNLCTYLASLSKETDVF